MKKENADENNKVNPMEAIFWASEIGNIKIKSITKFPKYFQDAEIQVRRRK